MAKKHGAVFAAAIVSAYLVGGLLTGAYYWNHRANQYRYDAGIDSTMAGIIWPVYWSARAALKITE